jgi:LysR family transcriptional regulator for bpeEF and oprC
MDKLSAMTAFVRVVEAGTFTKAADSLGVRKAQVTRLVQSLEEQLKILLLNRTTRRVSVTSDGAVYYDRAVRVLDAIQELESSMSTSKASPRGKLRIEVPTALANCILIPSLADFLARYPDINIDIGVSDKPVDLVRESVDCVLRAGAVTDPSLVARRIGDIRRIVCAAPSYLRRFGTPQHPSDFENAQHHVIRQFPRADEDGMCELQRANERHLVSVQCTVAVNDATSMLAAGLAGLGIVRTTPFMAAPHLADGRLVLLLPDWSAGVWPLHVVYPPNRHVSARLRVFIDWAADLFARELTKR